MKTNWNSTWPVIYQSPAAKTVLHACEGIQRISLSRTLNTPHRARLRETSGERKKIGGLCLISYQKKNSHVKITSTLLVGRRQTSVTAF